MPTFQNNKRRLVDNTSIWLLDIHSQLPSSTTTELVGFDTDATQVGHKAWLPENLSVRQWSVFDEVPKDLEGTFDIVNVRLIVFVIEEDPVPVLRNLLKLLSKILNFIQGGSFYFSSLTCIFHAQSPVVTYNGARSILNPSILKQSPPTCQPTVLKQFRT